MKRRTFLKSSVLTATTCLSSGQAVHGRETGHNVELSRHRVSRIEFDTARFRWPRLVGKNARIGVHGQDKSCAVVKLTTDQGVTAWGLSRGNAKQDIEAIRGKAVSDLIDPARGILSGVPETFDFALHDLAGIILNKPVYQLLGAAGPKTTRIYSGMIYLDELEPPESPAGFDRVMENCQWDVDYGYRQLKVKVGRSGRWYPHDEGLKADIDIVNRIHDRFGPEGIGILVDANDMYSLQDAIDFLKGVSGVPLFWFEEPFPEKLPETKELRDWMHAHGFEKTYLADGERLADPTFCLKLARLGVLDVCLHDVRGFGFTKWRQLMPKLIQHQTLAAPHAWGNAVKTNYSVHLAAGLGNCTTIEGVTCESDDIDFGDYPIVDGKVQVSEAPGFGMKLLK
jgi:L-alanine-DL-glutamate epimerase-like enolase superfamily enzyme